MFDVVVIGAGFSGMATAIPLAKAGKKVAIIEQYRKTAPLIRGFQREGCYFDTGFHYTGGLGEGQQLRRFLNFLGVMDRIEPYPLDQYGYDIIRLESSDREFRFPYGWALLKETFSREFPEEAQAIEAYFTDVKVLYDQILEAAFHSESHLDSLLDSSHDISLRDYLDARTNNAELKSILCAQSVLYGSSPEETSFEYHARVMGGYYDAAHGIKGSGAALADAFTKEMEACGIEIICSSTVEHVLVSEEGSVTGVRLTDGSSMSCEVCIHSGHPALIPDMVPTEFFRPQAVKRIGRLQDTLSAFVLYGATDDPPRWLKHSNTIVCPDTAHSICDADAPISQRPFFLSSCINPGNRNGQYSFSAIFPAKLDDVEAWQDSDLRSRPAEYEEYKKNLLQEMQVRIEQACPDMAGRFRIIDGATPLTLRDYSNSPLGSLYGVKHKVGDFDLLPRTRIPGFYISGQAIIAPGLFGAVLAGLVTAGTILGYNHLMEELMTCS